MRNWVGAGIAPPKSLNIFSKVGRHEGEQHDR